ncbi:unnamed protein product [marine sediment metagenome]|uniref:Uncharacterized protein n=1 Tax=marine sediment metagenome TaxID=412755 RepID=X1FMN4_9ZZZZ
MEGFAVIDSAGIVAPNTGYPYTILKLKDPPQGTVWVGGVYKKQLIKAGIKVLRSLNIHCKWYFLINKTDAEKVI